MSLSYVTLTLFNPFLALVNGSSYLPSLSVVTLNSSPFTVIVTTESLIGFPRSSVNFPVIVTLSPILASLIGSIVRILFCLSALNVSSTSFTVIFSFPALTLMLFVPATTLSTGTVNFPFSSVVVEYTLPLTVTLTGVFGTAFPS